MTAPDRTEAAEYYFTYIDQVQNADVLDVLKGQPAELQPLFDGISEQRSLYRYAPDKWTIREVLGHLNDVERLYLSRAFWFARGFDTPLPSFDQNVAIKAALSNDRSWRSHVDEFRAIRAATISFFDTLPAEAWTRRGTASGNPFSVRALAFICAGHVIHHVRILREQYLSPG